jgi:hypothetical protein
MFKEKGIKIHERACNEEHSFKFTRDAVIVHPARLFLLFQAKVTCCADALELTFNIHQE